MKERKDIGLRLENWARWCKSSRRRESDCMTGLICHRMQESKLGNVWSGHQERFIDNDDAMLIERGMREMPEKQRLLLVWCYIRNAAPEIVCRNLDIPISPISIFVEKFRAAQNSIENIVGNL